MTLTQTLNFIKIHASKDFHERQLILLGLVRSSTLNIAIGRAT